MRGRHGGTDKVAKVSGVLDFGNWLWTGFVLLTGLSGATMMAWLVSQLSWFWNTFQWAGILGTGIITWLLIGVGLNLYRWYSSGGKQRLKSETDAPILISGKHFAMMSLYYTGIYTNCTFTNVTFQYDGIPSLNISDNKIFGQ
jgi:hypothetical protein